MKSIFKMGDTWMDHDVRKMQKLLSVLIIEQIEDSGGNISSIPHKYEFTIQNLRHQTGQQYSITPYGASARELDGFTFVCNFQDEHGMLNLQVLETEIMELFKRKLLTFVEIKLGSRMIENVDALTEM